MDKVVSTTMILALVLGTASACVPKKGADTADDQSYTVTKKAYMHLAKARQHMEKKEWDDAIEELEDMKERKFLNPYERAVMWLTFALVYAGKEDLEKSAWAAEQALKLNALPKQEKLDTMFNLGQLFLVLEKYDRSAELLSAWLKEANGPEPSAYYITASAYAQQKKFKEALPYALEAVKRMKKDEEPWLQLLLSLRFELKQKQEVVALLKRLIKAFPKKQYWLQLSLAYSELDQNDKAIGVLELAYRQNMLTEQEELVNLAKLYVQNGVAVKGAKLLEQHMESGEIKKDHDTLELLAKAWLIAKDYDRAKQVLEAAAADAETGDFYLELGRMHVELHQWADARTALKKALDKDKLDNPGEAHLLLGIAHFNAGKVKEAMSALQEAEKHEESRSAAQQWISMIRGEGPAPEEPAEQPQESDSPKAADPAPEAKPPESGAGKPTTAAAAPSGALAEQVN